MQKGLSYMDYGLWLLTDDTGRITLNGYSERDPDPAAPTAVRTDHWPTFVLCDDRAQLPEKLAELGLELAAGADLNDLGKNWDVYLRHSDITALRSQLDSLKSAAR